MRIDILLYYIIITFASETVKVFPSCVNSSYDPSDSCNVEVSSRVQCLHDGASEAECSRSVCCWQTSDPGPACYYSYYEASGFLLRNLGCPAPTELSSSALSRHDCAVACLSSTDCISFSYHYTLDPQMCKLHSDSCEAGTVADVHTYNKVANTDYLCRRGDCVGNDIHLFSGNIPLCRAECESIDNCVGFFGVHSEDHGRCYLKYGRCEDTDLSIQPGQFCDKVERGVLLKTSIDDGAGMSPRVIRDDDLDTCLGIPADFSPRTLLRIRMSWPIHSIPNPNYYVTVIGTQLECGMQNTIVYMKIGATWGDPSFSGPMSLCSYSSESVISTRTHCVYSCEPAPEYSEAVFVFLRNYESATAEICEVVYSQ